MRWFLSNFIGEGGIDQSQACIIVSTLPFTIFIYARKYTAYTASDFDDQNTCRIDNGGIPPKSRPLDKAVDWRGGLNKVDCELALGYIVARLGGIRAANLLTVSTMALTCNEEDRKLTLQPWATKSLSPSWAAPSDLSVDVFWKKTQIWTCMSSAAGKNS